MAVYGRLLIALLLGGICNAESVHYGPLPVFNVSGTHYEVAMAIGRRFNATIHTAMSSSTFYNEKMLSYYNTADGKKLYDSLTQEAVQSFPQYVEEIQGLADGIELPFYKMMLWNMQFEWQLHLNKTLPTPSCSDLLLSYGQQQLMVGHNEDNTPADVNTTYIVQAVITDGSGRSLEQFTALCYAGELCGNAFGFNHIGLAFSGNAVFPKMIAPSGIVRNILIRAFLALKPHDVPVFLESFPWASGYSFNVMDMTAATVTNIEVAANGVSFKEIQGYGYHFNMYLHLELDQFSDPSSIHRLARVKELPVPSTPEQVLDVLGDTQDKDYPIFRTDTASDHVDTLCTALFQVLEGVLKIYRGNPATPGIQPVLTFSLPKGPSFKSY